MKRFKRILASFMVVCMVVGLIPSTAFAETNKLVDAAIFCSDVHGSTSDASSVFSGIKTSGVDYSTASFIGDTFNDTSSKYSTVTSVVQNALGDNTLECFYSYGSHDSKSDIKDYTGLLYGTGLDENYYVYAISQTDMQDSSEASTAATNFTTSVSSLDQTKPLFIISHMPLHDRRDDNKCAATWYTAISSAAEKMDITFFWAHNHTSENDVDKAAYYVEKDGSESMTVYNGGTVTPNFTYMNAGYINANGQNPARKGVATTVKIYNDSMVFQDYNNSGEYTGTYAHNVTVKREFAKEEIVEQTFTFEDNTSTVNVTAVASAGTITNVWGDYDSLDDLYVDYAAYNVELSDYMEGDDVKITMTIPEDMSTDNFKVYSLVDGIVKEVETFVLSDGVVSFSAQNDGIFAFGSVEITVPTDAVLKNVEVITTPDTIKYFTTENSTETLPLDISGMKAVATYESETEGTITKEIPWNEFGEVADGYSLTFDMTKIGKQDVVLTYTYGEVTLTDTFGIKICYENYEDTDTNVVIKFDTPSVTKVKVTDNTESDAKIETAVSGLVTTYKSYDFSFTGYTEGEKVTVTLPLPTGVTNPVVYHVANNTYKTTQIKNVTVNNDGTVTFTADQFSTYVVGESTAITVPDPKKETINETTTTVSGTYSIAGNPAEVEKVVTNGTTTTLGSTLTFTPTSGEPTTTDITTTATYAVVEGGDPNGIISEIEGNIVTFSGNYGKALVKVSYKGKTIGGTSYTVDNYIEITAKAPEYHIDITYGTKADDNLNDSVLTDKVVDKTIVIKGISSTSKYDLNYKAYYETADGVENVTPSTTAITWTSNKPGVATVDENGLVSFTGKNGTVQITVVYTYEEGKSVTDIITFSVSVNEYIVPSDGTDAFPEYPNEGSIRFDKTATAVGNFSETGIAQVELSMTGVPFTEGNEMDVVIMLDQSTSMDDDRISATVAATKAFINSIVINEDGSYNKNRIYVGYFNGDNTYDITDSGNIGGDLASVDNKTELDALFADIDDEFDGSPSSKGTNYAVSLEKCYERLKTAKTDGTGNERQQFCVFMSDGVPTDYQSAESTTIATSAIRAMFTGTSYDTRDTDYKYEYYSTAMKSADVTVYTVGLGLNAKNNAWNSASATQCLNAASILLNDISGPAKEGTPPDALSTTTLSKKDNYFYSVEDADAASEMTNVFKAIAQKILDAAKDVKVTDKIADDYTMVFDFPNATVGNELTGQEFYIEVKDYKLTPVYGTGEESTTVMDYTRGTATSLMKLYIGANTNGSYYAASDANGTAFAAPTFAETAIGTKYYWTTDSAKGDSGISVVSGATTYYFVSKGNGTHNIISGAYAYGTPTTSDIVDDETEEIIGTNTTCQNMIIATPYFVYNAATRMLVWTAEKLSSSELALSYFLYLDESAGYVGTGNEVPEDTYPTNDYANMTYTNFQGVECEQTFPIPQLTWNGAQVSYVFYLVNEDGQPVNRAGRVIPFSEAVYVTDTFTHAVTWNKNDASGKLEAQYLASERVPSVYELYDEYAGYEIYVYEDENAVNKDNHFKITAGNSAAVDTTYVFNTKSDKDKYRAPGTYREGDVHTGFDFSNTTVAFAVLWKPELVEDTVVIDYGLPVDVDVARNDAVSGAVTGVFDANSGVHEDYEINKGQLVSHLRFPTEIEPGDYSTMKYGKAEVINDTTVRYTPRTMKMPEEEKFYYVTSLNYYQEDTLMASRMYSSVTVIPATTVYYEDSFVDFDVYDKTDGKWSLNEKADWDTAGETVNSLQDTDRPGESKIAKVYDADNVYGYDSAYDNMSTYSLGSARKITVNENRYGTATFEFYGTGFDVIALTSNNTGTITVKTEKLNDDGSVSTKKNFLVDTYYGYTKTDDGQWVVNPNATNSLYQVPVIEASDIGGYGHYRVTIKAAYNDILNHTSNESEYDLFIDAIRIYDPANGGQGNVTITEAYVQDGEYQPEYVEVRNLLIDAATFDELDDSATVNGIMFIDGVESTTSVSDYRSYGPNNEVYLKSGQSIIFDIPDRTNVKDIQIGLKSADGNPVEYYISGKTGTLNTSTGMYYSILEQSGGTIVVANTSEKDSILSVTDIKFTQDPYAIGDAFEPASMIYSSRSTLNNAKRIITEDPKVYSVTTDKETYVPGETVAVTVKTNKATTAVTVNGENIEGFREKGNARYWTFKNTADNLGELEFTVVAYNELNEETDVVNTEVMVEKFVPKTFKLSLDKTSAVVKDKVKATVTTSDDVEDVTINGYKVTKYTYNKVNKTKTWSATFNLNTLGERTLKAVAYDKYGNAADAVSKTVTVKKFAPKTLKFALSKTTAVVKDKVKATVTTSDDVKYVTINGYKVTKYTYNKAKKTKTWTMEFKLNTLGKRTIKAVAYNTNGSASDAVSKSVTVKNFAPKTFKVSLDKSKVKKGAKYTVTVTTSSTVKYVTVNGKKVTKNTYSSKTGLRTFKVTCTAANTGKRTVKVYAYNANGAKSALKTKTLTVTKK